MSWTNETIRQYAPAVFADNPNQKVSDKYQFVPTFNVLDLMRRDGWEVIHAKQQKVRDVSSKDTTKHTLLLQRSCEQFQHLELGGLKPTIRIVNSHDWSSRFEILFGMLRLVCSNGLFVAGASFEAYSIRHDTIAEDLNNVLGRFKSGAARMLEKAQLWSEIVLTGENLLSFNMQAARIRFGEDATAMQASALSYARRTDDVTNDLWTRFNVVQENAIKGGFRAEGQKRAARALNNIARERTVNEELFKLAESFETI